MEVNYCLTSELVFTLAVWQPWNWVRALRVREISLEILRSLLRSLSSALIRIHFIVAENDLNLSF
jgi:hypothetical protein